MVSSRSSRSIPSAALLFLLAAALLATSTLATRSPESAQGSLPPSTGHTHDKQKLREEWSSVMGWVSIACWVIVYSPQMHQNYVAKSADGLSITFVIIWLAGDALNAAGALVQGLLWTMIILALYYCLCDCVLIYQYWYYGKYYLHGVRIAQSTGEADERTPLVVERVATISEDEAKAEQEASWKRQTLMYAVASLAVIATGVTAWYVAERTTSDGGKGGSHDKEPVGWRWDAQLYGWASALLYLSSRFPQILKNRTTKCEGLSLALFVFAVAGNITYVASILLKSTEKEYLIESSSWMVGSLGTIFLDFIVLGQFIAYRKDRKEMARMRRASISSNQVNL
ncbi:PQ-loop-domain-containing protein [Violaceomyces palustris]|uniref:PQ-loop-domain-containing protein n=1 Tax=Violaceomyces palustris TaxID=1673888 RepID=A0ACD0NRB3_9BASI|nr:PQ-loop-domain-containing protein [Violaceomyces palustris]